MILSPKAQALVDLATNASLYGYTQTEITRELAYLVPCLHPDDAATRFRGLRAECDTLTKIEAWATADDQRLRDAAEMAVERHEALVVRRLGEMFTPTTAYHDDQTPWSAEDTRRLVGADVAVAA